MSNLTTWRKATAEERLSGSPEMVKISDNQDIPDVFVARNIVNVDSGIAGFIQSRLIKIVLKSTFEKIPDITLTPDSVIASPPSRVNVTKTGFTIKLQTVYTGNINWTAIEI